MAAACGSRGEVAHTAHEIGDVRMTSPQPAVVYIRWMIRKDMREVLDIENDSFEFPWREEDFVASLRQRNNIGMVAEYDGQVAGYMIYELHATKVHVANFAVHPEFRRKGIGAAMVAKLKAKLSSQRRCRLTLYCRETNVAGAVFFRSQGFRAVRVVKGLYDDSPEDAYLMNFRYVSEQDRERRSLPGCK